MKMKIIIIATCKYYNDIIHIKWALGILDSVSMIFIFYFFILILNALFRIIINYIAFIIKRKLKNDKENVFLLIMENNNELNICLIFILKCVMYILYIFILFFMLIEMICFMNEVKFVNKMVHILLNNHRVSTKKYFFFLFEY